MFEIMHRNSYLIQFKFNFSQVILGKCYLENPGYKMSFILPLANIECSHRAVNELSIHYANE